MRTAIYSMGLFSLLSSPINAEMPVNHDNPGIKPTDYLPAIMADLRSSLKDPDSARDFVLCDPRIRKAFKYPSGKWNPAYWAVEFSLNAKNSYGGYTGSRAFTASFDNGELAKVWSSDLGPRLNAKILAGLKDCPRIADAEFRQMMQEVP